MVRLSGDLDTGISLCVTECGERDLLRKKHGLEPKSARMEDGVLLNDSIYLEEPLNSIVTDSGASGSSFKL